MIPADLPDQLRAAVEVDAATGCWVWLRSTNKGYGQVNWRGAIRPAHRVTYTLLVGDLSPDIHLHHDCRRRSCVNPQHTIPVTAHEHAAIHADAACKAQRQRARHASDPQAANRARTERRRRQRAMAVTT